MNHDDVIFKGNRQGLQIYLDQAIDFDNIKQSLCKRLQESGDFFKGVEMTVRFVGRSLTPEQQKELKELIEFQTQAVITVDQSFSISPESILGNDGGLIVEGPSKFVYNTIRSGQRITYNGNIIIIGDVNPGAEIIASGNILVVGLIRGMVHAGAEGNSKAIIVAGSIRALQLRIGSIIARSPDDDKVEDGPPEIAYVNNSEIIIEPYFKAVSITRR